MELQVVGILCALGAACFAALRSADRAGVAALLAGFAAALVTVTPARFPEPEPVGAAAALLAVGTLLRPRWWPVAALAAGAFAGLWVSVLRVQGLTLTPALLLAAALPAAGAALTTRRPEFAPSVLREEALLVVGGLGLLVAVGGPLADGWRSAGVLAGQPLGAAPSTSQGWLVAFVLGCVVLGGLYSLWKRR
ncbi:MAG TPA: hypothetical protein VFX89_04090 [Gammaproteobacteria bacterium]|nr:hypothetical protein [Gammaproteobacteria bacterium]